MFSWYTKKYLLVAFPMILIGAISFVNIPRIRIITWGISVNLPSWQSYILSGESLGVLDLTSSNSKITITKSLPNNSSKFVTDKGALLNEIYQPSTSPYPEFITNTITCGDEFIPQKRSVASGVIYDLLAGERFNYGVCSQDLVVYYSSYGIFDCGSKGVFEINVFSKDKVQPDDIANSFKC